MGWGLYRNTHGNCIGAGGHSCVKNMGIPATGCLHEIPLTEGCGSIFCGATQKGWCCYIISYSKQNNQNTSNHGFGGTKVLIGLSMQWVGGVNWIKLLVESIKSNLLTGGVNC